MKLAVKLHYVVKNYLVIPHLVTLVYNLRKIIWYTSLLPLVTQVHHLRKRIRNTNLLPPIQYEYPINQDISISGNQTHRQTQFGRLTEIKMDDTEAQVQAHKLLGQKTRGPRPPDNGLTRALRSCECSLSIGSYAFFTLA